MLESPFFPWTIATPASTSPRRTRPRRASRAWPGRPSTPACSPRSAPSAGCSCPTSRRYREPVLVASTDGVGTKIQVAIAAGVHDTVGYDLVAHCVNDILVQGAVPLFFLDYIALGTHGPRPRGGRSCAGFARGCAEFGCPLLGGETAEMPGTYAPGDYDLAGFIVGVVERERALTGGVVRAGDMLLGLPSAGLHTNGYTLARKVLFDDARPTRCDTRLPELGHDGRARRCSRPTALPGRARAAARARKIRALAHITGGGFPGNIPRVLPDGPRARDPPRLLAGPARSSASSRRAASVPDDEMFRTFNMGIGMIVVVAPEDLHEVEHSLERRGETSFVIGTVVRGAGVSSSSERRPRPSRVGVLISGRGINLQALIDARRGRPRWAATVAVVISNVADAPGLRARARGGHPRRRHRPSRAPARGARRGARSTRLRAHDVDLVCLAGYMRLLSPRLHPGLRRPHPERAPVAAAGLSRPRRAAAGPRARGEGERRHRAPRGRGARLRADRPAGGGAGARRRHARRRCPRASWRRSTGSTRAPCAWCSTGRVPPRRPSRPARRPMSASDDLRPT